jgi:CheY-like chemotaxis protein
VRFPARGCLALWRRERWLRCRDSQLSFRDLVALSRIDQNSVLSKSTLVVAGQTAVDTRDASLHLSRLASASVTHGKGMRKRQYVSDHSAPAVFVVDDEPMIASTLVAILRLHGYSARFFTTPLEALEAARTEYPDLLISDVGMPGISGIDLAILMRAQYPACKILLFSGAPTSFGLLESARAQGHDFDLILKPVPPPEFLAEIAKRVGRAEDVCVA